jgi:hypothetical protein
LGRAYIYLYELTHARSPRPPRAGGVKCGLVPSALAGRYRDSQPDLLSGFSYRVRGSGCAAWGGLTLTRTGGDVMWSPDRTAATWGARRFLFRNDERTSVSVCDIGGQTGVTVRSPEDNEVRLVVRPNDVGAVAKMLARLSG